MPKICSQLKAFAPIWVTELGMVTLDKERQFERAKSEIQVTEFGVCHACQGAAEFKGANAPMWVTELGIITLANELQR